MQYQCNYYHSVGIYYFGCMAEILRDCILVLGLSHSWYLLIWLYGRDLERLHYGVRFKS